MPRVFAFGLGVLGLALGLILLLLLLTVVDRLGAAPRALGDVGARASASASRAVQAARDALDPTHPPRSALDHDAEVDDFRRVDVGAVIAPHPQRDLTLTGVRKRLGAESPETAQYAVVDDRLRQPRETRVLGVVVSRSVEAREHLLYRSQLFRVGRALYKLNWVSFEAQQAGIVRLRSADAAVEDLAFSVD